MGNRLAGKVAIITGGGSGIGEASAKRFAEEGATVVVCGRRAEPLHAVVAAITAAGGKAEARTLDVTDRNAFEALAADVAARLGAIDILVNNAYSMAGALVAQMSEDDWHANFRGTLDGTFHGTRAVLPHMQARKRGAIVNVSSVCALLGAPYTAAYGAAKAGVIAFTRGAALEASPWNIRMNVVIPGVVLTPSTEAAIPSAEGQQATAAGVPLRRIGAPVEIANAILFLASDEASYITGTSLVVDGGKTTELATGASAMSGFDAA